MASVSSTLNYIQSSSPDYFFWSYTLIPCRTTFANFGPLTSYTPPPKCEQTPLYADIQVRDQSLFRCSEQIAYKSCMPSPSLASLWWAHSEEQCDKVYTFHSPADICPSGWSLGAQFTVELISNKDKPTVTSRWPDEVAPDGRYPVVAGTHRLCCPSSYEVFGGPSYGCQSLGYAPGVGNNSLCGTLCDSDGIIPCSTTTASNFAPMAYPPTLVTYGVEAVYLIGQGSEHDGMSRKDIALAATFSVLGALSLMILLLVVMRRRYLRRAKGSKPIVQELEMSGYSIQDTPWSNRRLHRESTAQRRAGGGAALGDVNPDDERAEQRTSFDPPPAYNSSQVWEGDTRPPQYHSG